MKIALNPPQAIFELGQRQNQEDVIFPKIGKATDKDRLFILCDGMGGHEKGEVASNTISLALMEYLDRNASADTIVSDETLLAALEYAYQQLDVKDEGSAKKMGTTLCLLFFHRGGVTAMHIGDSRIYHIRPSEHRIIYQSKDHSLVYDLYQAGEITYDEMRTSPQKNIITRAIQPGEDNRVRPAIVHITDIQPGDYFYICSDGMLEQMSNEELCDMVSAKDSDEKKHQQLIAATADNKDNHSAYLIHINNVVSESNDDKLLDDEQTSPDNAINIKPRTVDEYEVSIVSTQQQDVTQVDIPPKTKGNCIKRHKTVITIVGILALAVVVFDAFFIRSSSEKQTSKERDANKMVVISQQTNTKTTPIVRHNYQHKVTVVVKDVTPKRKTTIDSADNEQWQSKRTVNAAQKSQSSKASSLIDGQQPKARPTEDPILIKKIRQRVQEKQRKATKQHGNEEMSNDKL